MPRHKTTQNQNQDRNTSTSGHCRIRKRASSSSSSSSAVNKNYRSRGHFLQLWQQCPPWKLIMTAPGSPSYKLENDRYNDTQIHIKGKELMSARKLAAALWEINGLHSPVGLKEDVFEEKRDRKDSDAIADPPTPLCDQRIDRSKVEGHRRRSSAISQKLEIAQCTAAAEGLQTIRKLNFIEVASGMPGQGESVKTRLKEVSNSIIASKELVKVLFRILSQEEQHSSRITLVSALRVELDRARLQVDKLVQEQRLNSSRREVQWAEEKAGWKSRERERVASLAREVERERKLRRRADRLNKKLGMELADARGHFARAMEEVESERRARGVLEQTCDDLATGIGQERVAVEELKREAAKAREEVEKERQMLQLADALREERVQMKLAEARYEYEEKTAALERLKSDIIASYGAPPNKDEEEGQEDSGESELHSIELNMDNSNSYRWSFAACDSRSRSRRASTSSMDQVFKGRRSLSDNIQWETICVQRNTPPDVLHGNFNGLLGRSSQHGENFNEHGDQFKRNNTIRRSSTSPANSNSSPLREACTAILQDLASRRFPAPSP